ncbi:MAG: T9SS type A sorting domain-containing protein, partial [Bacteroidota bacterium]
IIYPLKGGVMFKKVSTLLLIAVFASAAVSFAGVKKQSRKVVSESPVFSNSVTIPSNQAAQSVRSFSKATADPSTGVVLGTTDYDYGWNSGWSRTIQTFNNGADVHMTYMHRDLTQASPNNRRGQKYVYYKTADGSMVTAFPRPLATGASGFGGIDVIPAGDGAGIAVMVYHTPNQFAIDGGPGQGQFTESAIPSSIPSAVLDPEITVSPDGGTLWYYDTKNRTEIQIAKSTDFGTSWTYVDSLLKYAPNGKSWRAVGDYSLDAPVLVAPNGDIILATTIGGNGNLPPTGSSHADSSDLIGYFKSTNGGANWTWTTWGKDGEALVVAPGDTVYPNFTNFGQLTAVIDNNNKVHMVVNGYSTKMINDSTGSNRFYTLYKTEGGSWQIISDKAMGAMAEYDSSYYAYNGNAIGNAYPTIAIDDAGTVFAAWSQAVFNGNALDTTGGFIQYELWWNFAVGGIWSTPTKVANSTGALFTVAAPKLSVNGNSRTAHLLYLADATRGNGVFGESATNQENIVYRTITFTTSSVRPIANLGPKKFELEQNYPNPFNPTTNIRYSIPAAGPVTLTVFNAVGQEVATLVNQVQDAGSYVASFDASRFSSGAYFYKVQSGNYVAIKKMMLLK